MNEAIRYAFLSDWVKEASHEEIVNKLIEHDERAKEISKLKDRIHALEKHNQRLQLEAQKYFDLLVECEHGSKENE